jgi:ferric-dicitrate binding protein FerR (iron transport regulator)
MSDADPREAALRRLVRDERAEPAPELDWSSLEERLLLQARGSTPTVKRSAYPYAWGALAVAAAAVLWLIGTRAQPAVSPSTEASLAEPQALVTDGDALAVGARVEAHAREVTVEHLGRAKWTLGPSSSALLAGRAERITVRLERGSVLSRVVPNPQPESFVVEAAGTRVAVHGTVFRVALEGGRVLVDVREGTVGVGPLGQAPAFLLKAPAHGQFAADGRSGSIDGRRVSASLERRGGLHKPTTPRSSASAVASESAPTATPPPAPSTELEVELPSEPSINDIEVGVARIVDATSACFSRDAKSANGVQITVRTALSLKILDSGAVTDVDFQPPLSPDAEACAATSIAQILFAPSKRGTQVTRMLELKR